MLDKRLIEKWAYDEAPNQVLRALCRAWLYADYLPQNSGQYRRCIIEPAIMEAIKDCATKIP